MKFGVGGLYNPAWNTTQVLSLVSTKNDRYTRQTKALLKNVYVIEFDWAADTRAALASSQGKIYWNSQLVDTILPGDLNVHHALY